MEDKEGKKRGEGPIHSYIERVSEKETRKKSAPAGTVWLTETAAPA